MKTMPSITTNYMTRVLLGQRGFRLPQGSLNESHLILAKKHLSQFDIVLTMDQLFSGEASPVLRRGLGWSDVDFPGIVGVDRFTGLNRSGAFSGSELWVATDQNKLDIELYRFATDIASSDSRFFRLIEMATEVQSVISETKKTRRMPHWLSTNVSCARTCGHICNVEFEFDK